MARRVLVQMVPVPFFPTGSAKSCSSASFPIPTACAGSWPRCDFSSTRAFSIWPSAWDCSASFQADWDAWSRLCRRRSGKGRNCRNPPGHWAETSPGGVFHGLRRRRPVPAGALGHAQGLAAQRLRYFRPARAGLLRVNPFHSGDAHGARQLADANLVALNWTVRRDHSQSRRLRVDAKTIRAALEGRFAAASRKIRRQGERRARIPGRVGPSAALRPHPGSGHVSRRLPSCPRPRHHRRAARILAKIPASSCATCPSRTSAAARPARITSSTRHVRPPRPRKMQNILSTGASIVLAANSGCLLQIQRELGVNHRPLKVLHTMELLDLSYRGEQP